MASRYGTRPGRPSVNSSARHRNTGGNNFANSPQYGSADRGATGEEDESSESVFPMWKTIAVCAVVFACFATVYPKMFHPMLLYVLGYGQQQNQPDNEVYPHPAMKHGAGFGPQRTPPFAGPSSSNERHQSPFPGARGPMPGMGAGPMGEVRSKSIWHWMLPFYTVGVIIFLLYTLSKILWKKEKKSGSRRRVNFNYEQETDAEEMEDVLDSDPDHEEDGDDPNGSGMSNRQLHGLQRRLQDTELAMHEILGQLEQLSTTADPSAAEQIKKMTMETLNGLGKLTADRLPSNSKKDDSENLGFTTRRGKGARFDSTEKRYLVELQKALSDFKQFTENYIDEHSQKTQGNTNTTATTEATTSAETKDSDREMEEPCTKDEISQEAESCQKEQIGQKAENRQKGEIGQEAGSSHKEEIGHEESSSQKEEIGQEEETCPKEEEILQEEETCPESDLPTQGDVDVMESEKECNIEELRIEEGEGELISMEGNIDGALATAEMCTEQETGNSALGKEGSVERENPMDGGIGKSPTDTSDEGQTNKQVRRRKGRKAVRLDE